MNPETETTAIERRAVSDEIIAKVALTGNLADLTPPERVAYMEMRCRVAGLEAAAKPFDLITTFDKEGNMIVSLHPNAEAAAQLVSSRKISVRLLDRETQADGMLIIVRAETPDGQYRDDLAYAALAGLSGVAYGNAVKRTYTQASRRAVLRLAGLGGTLTDDMEGVESAVVIVDPTLEITDSNMRQLPQARQQPSRQQPPRHQPSQRRRSPDAQRAHDTLVAIGEEIKAGDTAAAVRLLLGLVKDGYPVEYQAPIDRAHIKLEEMGAFDVEPELEPERGPGADIADRMAANEENIERARAFGSSRDQEVIIDDGLQPCINAECAARVEEDQLSEAGECPLCATDMGPELPPSDDAAQEGLL